MKHDRPRPDTATLRALAARGRLWLCDVLVWLAGLLGGTLGRRLREELHADLAHLRRGLAGVLVLLAIDGAHCVPGQRCVRRAPNAPNGFRRARHDSPMRAMTRLLPRGGNLRARIAALCAVIDELDAWIARMAARIDPPARGAALVLACALTDACVALATLAPAVADSS